LYRLKTSTLKFGSTAIDETTLKFNLPASNVTVVAEFELIPPQVFTVTIGTFTNGSITANPTSGVEGTEITLTVNPDNLYRLKAGTLKYGSTAINETILKFNLPASNVTVVAEFESSFIGYWKFMATEDSYMAYNFLEGGIGGYETTGNGYSLKGTWVHQGNNELVFTITHNASPGLPTLNDFVQEHETNTFEDRIFELISDTTIKRTAIDRTYTLVQ
jgi:hypothetical protein